MEPGTCLWLLLFLLLLFCVSDSQAENVYTMVRYREGETLSVQCSYTVRLDRWEGKVWCKVRRKKCDSGFSRGSGFSPPYKLHDDPQSGLLTVTMERLRHQDSGKYWCMRNNSRILYPVKGIQLVVLRAPPTEKNIPFTTKDTSIQKPDYILRIAVTMGSLLDKVKDLPMITPISTSVPASVGRMPTNTATISLMDTVPRVTLRSTPVTRTVTTAMLKITTRPSVTNGSPSKARSTHVASVSKVTIKARSSSTRSTTTKSHLEKLPPNSFYNSGLAVPMLLGGSFTILMFSVVFYVLWKKKRMGTYYV